MTPSITTYTGKTFWLTGLIPRLGGHGRELWDRSGPLLQEVDPDSIDIEDIAHALSQICRFTGHTREFYSVAQHSFLASTLVPPEHALQALLHDGSEAYLGDVSSPLKALLPNYKMLEANVQRAIYRRYGLPEQEAQCVKEADMLLLATEARDLMPGEGRGYSVQPHPTLRIHPMPPAMAKAFFLKRFEELQP